MSTPYRTTRIAGERKSAEPGIVDDMVRQFADRYAFLRELIQNGIDAGAKRLEVRIEREGDGHVLTSVSDDGVGMSRAIIEGPLLTLFSSSKEKDTTKIGKYGIGFVSVFAIEPGHVDVLTRTTANESWRVRLFGDHSYELSALERALGVGTTVTLAHSMTAEDFLLHVERCSAALVKWCRHASIPIHVVVLDSSDPSLGRMMVINEPMSVPGLVSVTTQVKDVTIVASVGTALGAPAEDATFGGFYNRGLTLFESKERPEDPGLEGIRFKVDSPRLSHTLSRDTIKRDDAYHDVVKQVVLLVKGPLLRAVEARLKEAAVIASAPTADHSAGGCLPLLLATLVPAFRSVRDGSRIDVPITDAVAGARSGTMSISAIVKASDTEVLVADQRSTLTRAISMTGRPIVRHIALGGCLRGYTKDLLIEDVERVFSFAQAAESEAAAQPLLCPAIAKILCSIGCPVGSVHFAHFSGAMAKESFRVIPRAATEAVTRPLATAGDDGDDDRRPPRAWGKTATLFLNLDDAAVRLAKRRARTDVEAAAHLLCRVLLVTDGAIAAKTVDRLIDASSGAGGL